MVVALAVLRAAGYRWPWYWCMEGKVVGIDLLPTEPVAGAQVIEGDVREPGDLDRVRDLLDGTQADSCSPTWPRRSTA